MKINFNDLPDVVAIVGSRSFAKADRSVNKAAETLVDSFVSKLRKGTVVVSGEAIGVDRYAKNAAFKHGLNYQPFEPDVNVPIPNRFFDRNTELVEWVEVNKGVIVAFTDANSRRGTADTIRKAERADIPLIEYQFTFPPFKHHKTHAALFEDYIL